MASQTSVKNRLRWAVAGKILHFPVLHEACRGSGSRRAGSPGDFLARFVTALVATAFHGRAPRNGTPPDPFNERLVGPLGERRSASGSRRAPRTDSRFRPMERDPARVGPLGRDVGAGGSNPRAPRARECYPPYLRKIVRNGSAGAGRGKPQRERFGALPRITAPTEAQDRGSRS